MIVFKGNMKDGVRCYAWVDFVCIKYDLRKQYPLHELLVDFDPCRFFHVDHHRTLRGDMFGAFHPHRPNFIHIKTVWSCSAPLACWILATPKGQYSQWAFLSANKVYHSLWIVSFLNLTPMCPKTWRILSYPSLQKDICKSFGKHATVRIDSHNCGFYMTANLGPLIEQHIWRESLTNRVEWTHKL